MQVRQFPTACETLVPCRRRSDRIALGRRRRARAFDGDVGGLRAVDAKRTVDRRPGRGGSRFSHSDHGIPRRHHRDRTAVRQAAAVMATVTLAGGGSPLHVIAGHLDSIIGTRRQAEALARYLDELKAAREPVILGIDTNALRGRADGAVRTLERSLPIEACGKGRTGSWLARVDFMFSNLPELFRRTCETFSERHGSDHAPLLLTIDY